MIIVVFYTFNPLGAVVECSVWALGFIIFQLEPNRCPACDHCCILYKTTVQEYLYLIECLSRWDVLWNAVHGIFNEVLIACHDLTLLAGCGELEVLCKF